MLQSERKDPVLLQDVVSCSCVCLFDQVNSRACEAPNPETEIFFTVKW